MKKSGKESRSVGDERILRFSVKLAFWLTQFFILAFLSPCFFQPGLVAADRGSFSARPARLIQSSQKAVIFHNKQEEILVLATELRAEKETFVLEFIPFPAEPLVFLVKDPILEKVGEFLKKKDIREEGSPSKGGGGAAPVEIKFSQKMGIHDVTVVKINQPAEFESWVKDFFKGKKVQVENQLDRLIGNARDYLERGFNYFVFDSVAVGPETRTVEPLAYRFKSAELYYPLKTSNLVGGSGMVELVLILPGSFCVEDVILQEQDQRYFELFRSGWSVSSSSRMYPAELGELLPEAASFFKPGQKIYLQLLRYVGPYDFKDDLRWDISGLPRYAHKIRMETSYGLNYAQKMTEDEIKDYLQAKCAVNPGFLKESRVLLDDTILGYLLTSGLTCEDFVHPEEFEVYKAIYNPSGLNPVQLDGLPTGFVVLEDLTANRKFEKLKGVEKALLEDYQKKNKKEYRLSEFLPEGLDDYIQIRQGERESLLSPGENHVSRVGFNPGRTAALVFVSHVAAPEMGAGYLVQLEKYQGAWRPVKILSAEIY
ncbi:MAG: DUF2330 domain-containing protein [Candidatus Saccharicenans sp.]|nr:DUF2330 domain-containing protein [Candidatus Saccharicenans sp.]